MTVKSTKDVAKMLGIKVSTLSQAVWQERIPEPQRGPGQCFLWGEVDIQNAQRIFGNNGRKEVACA